MTIGLHIFDAGGNLILDTTQRVGKVLGVTSVTGSFSFYVPTAAGETVFAVPYISTAPTYVTGQSMSPGSLTISGNTVYGVTDYYASYGGYVTHYIIYGTY